ncbi:MAG: type IV secretory system conjugative DNA transfer family protein [Formosimonas sp.]
MTYYNYVKSLDVPKVAVFATQIKVSGVLGFGAPMMAYVLMLYGVFKSKPQSLHGDARFANNGDLAKVHFYTPTETSIIVGQKDGKPIHFSGQQFVILAAPTRSGKGVSMVIPNLLSYQGSLVALDIKQENYHLTSGYRKHHLKQEVFLFNPFAEDGRTHRWNPLSYISNDPHHRVSDLNSIAAMLYPDAGADQKFWVAQSRNAFLALALYLFDQADKKCKSKIAKVRAMAKPPTLGEIYRLSSGEGSNLKQYLKSLSEVKGLSAACQTAFAGLTAHSEKTFSSVMGTFRQPLSSWINPIVDAATSANDFLLTDVRKKKMTIYIGILPNKLAEAQLILNLFFSQLINENTKELPQNNAELQHQCLLLMDEFTSIGKVDIIAKAVSYMAGYNIRLLPIIQSMAQLDATYGREDARTLITNHALQVLFTPREQRDANDYSEMLGYHTVRKESITRGREVSRSESEQRRALMLPQELKAMSSDTEVFLYEGIAHPVMCNKIKYYEDKTFTSRLLPAVVIKPLFEKPH